METLDLVRRQADKLLTRVEQAGYYEQDITDNHVHDVVGVLEDIRAAESADEIPRQVGGTLFFKAVAVEDELGLDNFATDFRKIHEALGRDAELEQRLVEGEEALDDETVRRLDEQDRRRFE